MEKMKKLKSNGFTVVDFFCGGGIGAVGTEYAGFNTIFHIINKSSLENQKIPSEVQKLASLREKMRNQQKWEEADQLRGEIEKLGWLIEDLKDSQKLLKKK